MEVKVGELELGVKYLEVLIFLGNIEVNDG